LCYSALGQTRSQASAAGKLSVTATVSGSVALIIGGDGKQTIVVANAPADEAGLICARSFTPQNGSSRPRVSPRHVTMPRGTRKHRKQQKEPS
jgi:hypothetical protein